MRIAAPCFLFIAFISLAISPLKGSCQNLTGIWRGWFTTETGEQYKYELQIKQSKSNHISGVSYSYLDTRFYGKATLSGSYIRKDKSALIQEIKTIEVKMSGGSVACIMKCLFNFSKSGKEEFLEGKFTSMYEKSDPLNDVKRGGNCGGGSIFLRKVPTSDFYVEPFLKHPTPEKKKTTTKPPVHTTKKPPTKTVTTNKSTNKTSVKKDQTVTPPKRDSVKRNNAPVIVEKPKEIPRINIPQTTRSRENELVKTLTITNEEISVRLYDNGEVDGDSISVYLDGKPIVYNKGLSTVPITIKLKLDDSNPEHVLVMVAENMGRIPPNTSLMIVQDGDRRYQVSITSTEQKNAMVRFRYEKQ